MIKILKQIVLVTILLGVIVCICNKNQTLFLTKARKTVNNLDSIIKYMLSNVYFDFGSKTIRTDDIKNWNKLLYCCKTIRIKT